MSLGDHLEELRRRIVWAIAAPLPLMFLLFAVSNQLLEIMTRPHYAAMTSMDLPPVMQVLSPPEMFLVKLKVSAIFALIFSAPWIFYHAWMFIAPGLYREERRFIHLLVPGSVLLTVVGLLLLYYVMLPLMLQVLVMVGTRFEVDMGPRLDPAVAAMVESADGQVALRTVPPPDPEPGELWVLVPEMELFIARADAEGVIVAEPVRANRAAGIQQPWRLREVVDFTLLMLAAIVIAFQLPLAMMLLGWTGLLDPAWLSGQRRYALFGCAVASAVLTPQDIVSMILMLVPLYGLFELGLLLMKVLPADRVARGIIGGGDDGGDGGGDGGGDDGPGPGGAGGGGETGPGDRDPGGPSPAPLLPVPGSEPDAFGGAADVGPGVEEAEPAFDAATPPSEPPSDWPRPASGTVARRRQPGIDPAAFDAEREAERGGEGRGDDRTPES